MPPHQLLLLLLLSILCSQVVNCYFCLCYTRFHYVYSQTAGWVQTTYRDRVRRCCTWKNRRRSTCSRCFNVRVAKRKPKTEKKNTCNRFIVISIEISTISFHLHEVNFRQNDLDSMCGIYTIRRTQMIFYQQIICESGANNCRRFTNLLDVVEYFIRLSTASGVCSRHDSSVRPIHGVPLLM